MSNRKLEVRRGLELSLKVLSFLKKNKKIKDIDVGIGCFTNRRECGLTYIVYPDNAKYEYFTFCTYEHRNSDSIIINGNKGILIANGDLPYRTDSKWDTIASFGYDEYEKCATKLADLIYEWDKSGKLKGVTLKKQQI